MRVHFVGVRVSVCVHLPGLVPNRDDVSAEGLRQRQNSSKSTCICSMHLHAYGVIWKDTAAAGMPDFKLARST